MVSQDNRWSRPSGVWKGQSPDRSVGSETDRAFRSMSALALRWTRVSKAASISRSLPPFTTWRFSPARAACLRCLRVIRRGPRIRRIHQQSESRAPREAVRAEAESLCHRARCSSRANAGDVAAGTSEARDKSYLDRIAANPKYDRDCRRSPPWRRSRPRCRPQKMMFTRRPTSSAASAKSRLCLRGG